MSAVIRVTIDFTIRRVSEENCKKFQKPLGIIELLDSDGYRQAFCETQEEARTEVERLVKESGLEFNRVEVHDEDNL